MGTLCGQELRQHLPPNLDKEVVDGHAASHVLNERVGAVFEHKVLQLLGLVWRVSAHVNHQVERCAQVLVLTVDAGVFGQEQFQRHDFIT